MEIYFVRHAQSVGNKLGRYDGHSSEELSEEGLEQATKLADRLSDFSFDVIICSPSIRAMKTIHPYLKATGRKAMIWPEASEACWHGDNLNMDFRELIAGTPHTGILPLRMGAIAELQSWADNHFFIPEIGNKMMPPAYETYKEGMLRITWFYKRLIRDYLGTGKKILVVGHYHAGSRLLEMFLQYKEITGSIKHNNTGISRIVNKESMENFSPVFLNMT